MRQGLSQNLAQKQTLVLTQRMQQAIHLLQMSHQDLLAEVQSELSQNPTLEEERVNNYVEPTGTEAALQKSASSQAADLMEQNNGGDGSPGQTDWKQILADNADSGAFKGSAGPSNFDDMPPIEASLTEAPKLVEHLVRQLGTVSCTDAELDAAQVIILNLDGRGWLETPLPEIAAEAGVDLEDVEGALEIVQGLDPVGCGARSLGECLTLQARQAWPEDPTFVSILGKHLHDLQTRNYQAIAKGLDLEMEDVVEYHKMIRTLEPWPARPFGESTNPYITPDVEVVKEGGAWTVRFNDDGLPKLRVSGYYQRVLEGKESSKEDQSYIKERLDAARFLIESIYQREKTIKKVMSTILERQQEFFENGPEHLRPMVLKDVADEIGVHESTVSRATSNKFVLTPKGIFELKFFFDAAIQRTNGDDLAGEAIREKIRKLVASENKKKPLSDEEIVTLLKKEKVDIARRTVAKYRDALGILPSTQRKQLF